MSDDIETVNSITLTNLDRFGEHGKVSLHFWVTLRPCEVGEFLKRRFEQVHEGEDYDEIAKRLFWDGVNGLLQDEGEGLA